MHCLLQNIKYTLHRMWKRTSRVYRAATPSTHTHGVMHVIDSNLYGQGEIRVRHICAYQSLENTSTHRNRWFPPSSKHHNKHFAGKLIQLCATHRVTPNAPSDSRIVCSHVAPHTMQLLQMAVKWQWTYRLACAWVCMCVYVARLHPIIGVCIVSVYIYIYIGKRRRGIVVARVRAQWWDEYLSSL